jgi:hypothetical protein
MGGVPHVSERGRVGLRPMLARKLSSPAAAQQRHSLTIAVHRVKFVAFAPCGGSATHTRDTLLNPLKHTETFF